MGRLPGSKNKTKATQDTNVKEAKEFNDSIPRVGVKTINGIDYFEINELYRVYNFPNGEQLQIDSVKYLNVSASGGHRIITLDGRVWYVKPHESWFMEIGPSPFLQERGFVI